MDLWSKSFAFCVEVFILRPCKPMSMPRKGIVMEIPKTGFVCLLHLSKTWSSNAAQRLDCRTRRMDAVHSWTSPPGPTMATSEGQVSAVRAWHGTSRCFAPRTMETRRSECSAQSTSFTSLPGGSPCRRFHEGHQVAGSTDKFGSERPCREVFVLSVFEEGTAAGPLPHLLPNRKSRLPSSSRGPRNV